MSGITLFQTQKGCIYNKTEIAIDSTMNFTHAISETKVEGFKAIHYISQYNGIDLNVIQLKVLGMCIYKEVWLGSIAKCKDEIWTPKIRMKQVLYVLKNTNKFF
jgi:hypothetical protein